MEDGEPSKPSGANVSSLFLLERVTRLISEMSALQVDDMERVIVGSRSANPDKRTGKVSFPVLIHSLTLSPFSF